MATTSKTWRFIDAEDAIEKLEAAGAFADDVPLATRLAKLRDADERAARTRAARAAARMADADTRAFLDEQAAHAALTVERLREEASRKRERLVKSARERAAEAEAELRTRPAGANRDDDRDEQARWLEYGKKLDPVERDLMARNAAKAGTHRPMLRAWLSEPTGPWAAASVPPLLRPDTVKFIDDWTVTRAAPGAVQDEHAAWQLDRRIEQSALAPWQPDGGRTPATPVLDTRADGVRVLRP